MVSMMAAPVRQMVKLLVVGLLAMTGASADAQTATGPAGADPAAAFLAGNHAAKGVIETASGLQYRIMVPGTGSSRPTDQDVALVNYEGRLVDGTVFDKSPQPMPMPITGVVPGFAEALKLMPKGATYRFWIPPGLAYGDAADGPIPAHSVLVFDIELLDFMPADVVRRMQQDNAAAQAPDQGTRPAPAR